MHRGHRIFHTHRTNIIASSMAFGLEVFSHNLADRSFTPLPNQTGTNTNYLNQCFLFVLSTQVR
ncbi:hypothetical protein BT69DRAFT_1227691 [Atractiella rhizophila]|nr:hypothetical protein BT69DRAFT_1227691 [Atractiella rhizophila]